MRTLFALTKRNIKLFFKDKGMFFTSLITPLILLVLYVSFLGDVYRESFLAILPEELGLSNKIINGLVGGELISSILAVSCVTVTFCSGFLSVQDRASGVVKDLKISPVGGHILSLSYYISNLLSSLIICFCAMLLCLGYIGFTGWFLSAADVMLLALDVLLIVLFGSALSSIINSFLSSQGQISAVGTIVSSGYGFICGAYMPISQFDEEMRNIISCLPGTYATSLVRNHALGGVLSELEEQGVPRELVEGIRDMTDCNLYFFGERVSAASSYAVLCGSILLLLALCVLIGRKKEPECASYRNFIISKY